MKFLSVDSGGTKTLAIVTNDNLEIIGTGRGGPGNYHRVGTNQAKKNISDAIEKAFENKSERADFGAFGIGGLDTQEDYEIISDMIEEIGMCDTRKVVNDVIFSYYSSTGGKPGVSVVAGTGSIGYGRNEEGEDHITGGWDWIFGDEGSGFYISKKALQAASKAYDGRGKETSLVEKAKEHFDLDDFREIIPETTKGENYNKIPTFSKVVMNEAKKGDDIALKIVKKGAKELTNLVFALKKKLDLGENFLVGCSGGLFSSDFFYDKFVNKIKSNFPQARTLNPIKNPVIGGIALGMEKTQNRIPIKDLQKLDNSI